MEANTMIAEVKETLSYVLKNMPSNTPDELFVQMNSKQIILERELETINQKLSTLAEKKNTFELNPDDIAHMEELWRTKEWINNELRKLQPQMSFHYHSKMSSKQRDISRTTDTIDEVQLTKLKNIYGTSGIENFNESCEQLNKNFDDAQYRLDLAFESANKFTHKIDLRNMSKSFDAMKKMNTQIITFYDSHLTYLDNIKKQLNLITKI